MHQPSSPLQRSRVTEEHVCHVNFLINCRQLSFFYLHKIKAFKKKVQIGNTFVNYLLFVKWAVHNLNWSQTKTEIYLDCFKSHVYFFQTHVIALQYPGQQKVGYQTRKPVSQGVITPLENQARAKTRGPYKVSRHTFMLAQRLDPWGISPGSHVPLPTHRHLVFAYHLAIALLHSV